MLRDFNAKLPLEECGMELQLVLCGSIHKDTPWCGRQQSPPLLGFYLMVDEEVHLT